MGESSSKKQTYATGSLPSLRKTRWSAVEANSLSATPEKKEKKSQKVQENVIFIMKLLYNEIVVISLCFLWVKMGKLFVGSIWYFFIFFCLNVIVFLDGHYYSDLFAPKVAMYAYL